MKVAVVTCTIGRPELFKLCGTYIDRQTLQPDEWIVHEGATGLHPFENLAEALRRVSLGHHVVIMEDDDWFASTHVENMVDGLCGDQPISGIRLVRRYNFPARRWEVKDNTPPGGSRICLHKNYVAEYASIVGVKHGRGFNGERVAWKKSGVVADRIPTLVYIKGVGYGLPGLKGWTGKHNPKSRMVHGWSKDENLEQITAWIGEKDVAVYLDLMMGCGVS